MCQLGIWNAFREPLRRYSCHARGHSLGSIVPCLWVHDCLLTCHNENMTCPNDPVMTRATTSWQCIRSYPNTSYCFSALHAVQGVHAMQKQFLLCTIVLLLITCSIAENLNVIGGNENPVTPGPDAKPGTPLVCVICDNNHNSNTYNSKMFILILMLFSCWVVSDHIDRWLFWYHTHALDTLLYGNILVMKC